MSMRFVVAGAMTGQGPWATDQWVAFEVGVDIDVAATARN
jgi:hypothetical protein